MRSSFLRVQARKLSVLRGQPIMGTARSAHQTGSNTASIGTKFQWIETPTGELVLMSLAWNRYLRIDPKTQAILCDSAGPATDGKEGARLVWALAAK